MSLTDAQLQDAQALELVREHDLWIRPVGNCEWIVGHDSMRSVAQGFPLGRVVADFIQIMAERQAKP